MNNLTSAAGLEFIRLFEGYSPIIYKCAGGYQTIGYGHMIKPGETFSEISHDQALKLLNHDLSIAEQAVRRLITCQLVQYQFDMLVSFVFNLGAAALQRSCLRAKVNRGEHEEVSQQFQRFVYASGRVVKSLVRRRLAESQIYLYGYKGGQ